MSDSEIITLACDPMASHIINAYFESETVGQKSRDKLVYKFKGSYVVLACSQFGSRSLETMWNVSNNNIRSTICSELVSSENKLQSDYFGKIIFNKFHVRLFKISNGSSNWQNALNNIDKKRKLLSDLIKDDDESTSVKKKKHKSCDE